MINTVNPDIQKRVSTIQKLLTQASCPGATAAEAEAFMGKAQQLIERYNISQTMLQAEQDHQRGDEPIIQEVVYDRAKGKMPTWMMSLLHGISDANRCQWWYNSSKTHCNVTGIGTVASLTTIGV